MTGPLEPERVAEGLQAFPEVAAALTAVLRAGNPSRLKALTVACPNDHVLARVYRTGVGLVVVHQTDGVKKENVTSLHGVGEVQLPPTRGPRAEMNAYVIEDAADEMWPMTCACRRVEPYAWQILDAISAGVKRLRVGA